jgi:hypothetical protein
MSHLTTLFNHMHDAPASPAFPSSLLEGWLCLFVNRSQPYAIQQPDGTYRWRQGACDLDVLAGHLTGALTLAFSSTDVRGWCKWMCLDADAPDGLPQLVVLARWLAADGLPGVLEASRRGGHLWLLLAEVVPATAARYAVREALDRAALAGIPLPSLEIYPDRDSADGLGHAMRLPLGVHQRTHTRYPLLDAAGRPRLGSVQDLAATLVEQAPRVRVQLVRARWERFVCGEALYATGHEVPHSRAWIQPEGMQTVGNTTEEQEEEAILAGGGAPGAGRDGAAAPSATAASTTRSGVIRWVDAHVSPLAVLDELAPDSAPHRSGAGYIAWCPFHEDCAPDADGRPGSPSFYLVHNECYGWSWRCLSPNCVQHSGPMRHTFRLFQELLRLDAAAAIRAAAARWPEAAMTRPACSRRARREAGRGATWAG